MLIFLYYALYQREWIFASIKNGWYTDTFNQVELLPGNYLGT